MGGTANFDKSVNMGPANNIGRRTSNRASRFGNSAKKQKQWWNSYLRPSTKNPKARNPHGPNRTRFGTWWKGYEKSYDKILSGTEDYRSNWNTVFDDNEQYLDTTDIQNEWSDYLGRVKDYYGQGRDDANAQLDANADLYAGYDQDFIDREGYDLWGDLAKGGTQATQDWFAQSDMGKYLEDQANENFWRQAQLGGMTYNPQEVQNYINNAIVAPEAQQGFQNLAEYARLQPELSWQVTAAQQANNLARADLAKWYTDAVANGDTYAQQQIADLMNQQDQQMWQSNTVQGLGDAQLEYLINAQLPATRTMDFTNQKIAHKDMQRIMKMAGRNREMQFNFLANGALPNAYDSMLWQSGMYQQALGNQESAMNAAMQNELAAAGIGAAGSIFGGLAGAI